jgi:hypothetical protein
MEEKRSTACRAGAAPWSIPLLKEDFADSMPAGAEAEDAPAELALVGKVVVVSIFVLD